MICPLSWKVGIIILIVQVYVLTMLTRHILVSKFNLSLAFPKFVETNWKKLHTSTFILYTICPTSWNMGWCTGGYSDPLGVKFVYLHLVSKARNHVQWNKYFLWIYFLLAQVHMYANESYSKKSSTCVKHLLHVEHHKTCFTKHFVQYYT